MGEAARRKRAGIYPDPLATASRSFCGRGPTRVQDFRVPDGVLAITFDVQGATPSTCMMNAAELAEVLEKAAEVLTQPYYNIVRWTAAAFLQAKKTGDDQLLEGLGTVGIWTALNHPTTGEAMRRGVSRHLRESGKAHLTWHFTPATGLGIALGDTFVDLEALQATAAAVMPGQAFIYEEEQDAEEGAMQ